MLSSPPSTILTSAAPESVTFFWKINVTLFLILKFNNRQMDFSSKPYFRRRFQRICLPLQIAGFCKLWKAVVFALTSKKLYKQTLTRWKGLSLWRPSRKHYNHNAFLSVCLLLLVVFRSISILYACGSTRLKSFSKPLNVTFSWPTDNSSRAEWGGTNLKWQMSPPIRPDPASWKATTNDSADF